MIRIIHLILGAWVMLAGLMACDPENNPTTMKGRTITPARLPKVQPMTVPKIPAGVREQTTGTNGRRPTPTPPAPNGDPNHDP